MARKKAKVIVGFAVIGICLVYLVISGFQKTALYYFTVDELEAREHEFVGKRIKLAGRVVPGSIQLDVQTLAVEFRIWEPADDVPMTPEQQRTIYYKGIVPDTFKDCAEVVVLGGFSGARRFTAQTITAKCPSKYEEGKSGDTGCGEGLLSGVKTYRSLPSARK